MSLNHFLFSDETSNTEGGSEITYLPVPVLSRAAQDAANDVQRELELFGQALANWAASLDFKLLLIDTEQNEESVAQDLYESHFDTETAELTEADLVEIEKSIEKGMDPNYSYFRYNWNSI
jgi:hypothetical protein